MIIRSFRLGDEISLQKVYLSAITEIASQHYTPQQINAWTSKATDMVSWTHKIKKIRPFVALKENRIVGYASIDKKGYIEHFYVSGLEKGSDIRTLLMEKIHQIAEAQQNILLTANVSITARPFFHQWGFNSVLRQIIYIHEIPLENFRMVKRLSSETL